MRSTPLMMKGLALFVACLASSRFAAGQISNSVNYRGQPQADLTCAQLADKDALGATVVYRNDPSTNCFGFPSIQFDSLPVEGGKPNGITIDWSLMVDELQMQDDDRLHIHLPGFTGGHNTFGIMGPAINAPNKGMSYAPNFDSEFVAGDKENRADFGALVGIWGISCGTEGNLYMDRAKVDNIRTAEWDPSKEMLKVVIKGRRFGPASGRHDGYVGYNATGATNAWVDTTNQGKAIPFSATSSYAAVADNSKSVRGNHLQAFEYSREGPSGVNGDASTGTVGNMINFGGAEGTAWDNQVVNGSRFIGNFLNDGYVHAPGTRVCGIYIDPTKLHRAQRANQITNGLGPLPPYGGIGKNWYKLAYIRRFASAQCVGGFADATGRIVRPGMSPETCSIDKSKTTASLANFWQVPFDGDSERVVGYQFTTTSQQLPTARGALPSGTVVAPTFSFAQAKGKTDGPARDNCITVSLIPSVTMVSGSTVTQITIKGLKGSGTSDSDTLALYADDSCTSLYTTLAGSNGAAIKSFQPVKGTAATGETLGIQHTFRPVGRMAFAADGSHQAVANKNFDNADWHTRARQGTTSALTTGGYTAPATMGQSGHKSTIAAAAGVIASKLSSPVGDLVSGNGAGKFVKADGTLTVGLTPGYYLQAGELLVFSFKLQNAKDPQDSQALTVSASGTYCDASNRFCSGASDQKLDIQDVPIVDKGKLLQTKMPYFATSKIFQASADPDFLTTIFVTLKPNVDLKKPDSTADAKITISNLCGFQTGSNVVLYQNQKSGGLPLNDKDNYPVEAVRSQNDLPGLAADDLKHIDHRADWDAPTGTLKIKLGTTGFLAETTYAFAFQLQTGKVANAACVPKISSSGGSETLAEQDFASATNVGMTMDPQFTTIKIGQVTTRPDVTNYLCVTLQHNYQFYSDSVVVQNAAQTGNYIESKITISGLLGTQAVSTAANGKGYALAYCPTDLVYFDDKTTQHTSTQFQPDTTTFTPKRYKTFGTTCFGSSAATQQCVPGNPYVPDDAFDSSAAGRSWFGGQTGDKDTFTWDQATGTAVLTVDPEITKDRKTNPQTTVGGIPKNAQIVFALPLQNPNTASDCQTVTFEASGRITQKATFVQTKTGRALQDGEQDGDACALKVYAPGFLVKKVTQSTAVTGDDNIITVSLRTNVDFASVASGQASYITISGLTGTATSSTDMGIIAPRHAFSPKFQLPAKWTQGTGTLELKLDAGACVPPTVYAVGQYYDWETQSIKDAPFAVGGSDSAAAATVGSGSVVAGTSVTTSGMLGQQMPSTCIKAGFTYVFSFQVLNPSVEQAAPAVSIGGRYRDAFNNEKIVANTPIDAPISDDADKVPMRISDQTLTTVKIGQLIPAPAAINLICVTLQTSKDIKSQANAPLSSITISGLTGFDASEQQLQLYEADGTTIVAGGNPADGSFKVGTVFTAQNTKNRDSEGAGFVKYDGSSTGNIIMWVRGDTGDSTGVFFMQKNVEHKFCFRLKNPKAQMDCKDVSLTVNNQGKISTVKAEQDMTTTIEDYSYGSACAGYVASPGFVVANWRSSSNTTGATVTIHLELATNILLEQADKITISGLNSYTRSCSTPPCDVGIDVTRVAVNYLYGKPYINGRRSVLTAGTGDKAASADDRRKFALAIQSYDLTGTKDGGFTSTFGDNAAWGQVGDTSDSASTLTLTVATGAKMLPSDITVSSEATLYEIVFTLTNKAAPVDGPAISINIGQGQMQYPAQAMNIGQTQPKMGISKVGDGGMEISYTPMKTIYGGESLVLTLPQFKRDTNGMLFGITSSPNSAFSTYANWQDWKAYGTKQKYARAFFTNGWYADGISAKSGDSGQTGERWNYPNINAKVTTDADYNRDTGVFVLDSKDPGVGQNKNYWYANTEDNVYEGRITRVSSVAASGLPGATLSEATTDYFLDNGEALVPIASVDYSHYEASNTGYNIDTDKVSSTMWTSPTEASTLGTATRYSSSNGYRRPHLVVSASANGLSNANSRNNLPGNQPTDAYRGKAKAANTPEDNFAGTPPFRGIPERFQPSRRDNFYRGMLIKCWIGTKELGGKTDYSEDTADLGTALTNAAGMYRASGTNVKTLLPPPERIPGVPTFDTVDSTVTADAIKNAKAFEKAGVSPVLETRVIQASFRQIDYIPRKLGGCHWTGIDNATDTTSTIPASDKFQQAGCQDEVPGYPAVIRLEAPFSKTLDPDTLCYIQRKADVGVYTGMTAMIGNKEYTIKQGAANIYTVGHIAKDMTGPNGDPVDRKVPRSYSTEDAGLSPITGLRGAANTVGFFKDSVGLSGQPYLIYSQLELVAKRGAKVSVGETITIKIPTRAMIMPPANMKALITPANDKDTIADKVKISHVLLVPLSSACSIVSVYGVQSGCQYDNRRGGSFDLILSTQWPYAYDGENKNDLTGYGMTVFGGQATVITAKADKYSQDLPVRPLEGATIGSATVLDLERNSSATGRQQTKANGQIPTSNIEIDATLTVVRELETLYLTGGTSRTEKLPKLPNAPITLTSAGCGSKLSDSLGPATLPYAVCLSLGGSLAHNQFLHEGSVKEFGINKLSTSLPNAVDSFVATSKIATPRQNQDGVIVAGVQSITGAVGQEVTPVVPAVFSSIDTSTFGSARPRHDGGVASSAAALGSLAGTFENPADNLGLGAFIIVGVYTSGTSDRFVWAGQANKGGVTASALPKASDMAVNHVVQRYLGVSRQTIPLSNIPSGLIGGNSIDKPAGGYPAPAGDVPRYQARVSGGYSIGRFAYGQSRIMRVRSDVTSNALPLGESITSSSNNVAGSTLLPVVRMAGNYHTASALPTGLPVSSSNNDQQVNSQRDTHHSGFPSVTSTPNAIEKIFYGRSTLPLPQVIHTAEGQATTAATSRLTRGHCGQVPRGPGLTPTSTVALTSTNETCATAATSDFNLNLPFSRNVYIEQGQDVYIISSLFDTLIQRPEPPRQHVSSDGTVRTIEGNPAKAFPGYFASNIDSTKTWPGDSPTDSNASPRPTYMRPRNDLSGLTTAYGLIQTSGTVVPKAAGASSNTANWGSNPAAANQYGFDQDFRLYSVLGPFMGPAKIKDVWDSSKIPSAYTSNFPGVLTIHAKVSSEPTTATPVFEIMQNNALYHTAPVVGTTYLKKGDRTTQYHMYKETDKIISFCNPLQSDLNNAPGAVLNNEISDDPVSDAARKIGAGTGFRNSVTGFVTTNGVESSAPSQWTVPRRHHICRKLVTGAPELTVLDKQADPHFMAGADAAEKERVARYRYTESIRFNNVLNQEPSPNMRAMVTFVEPTTISVNFGSDAACEVRGKFSGKDKVDSRCSSITVKAATSSVVVPVPVPDWFQITVNEVSYDAYNFTVDDYPEMTKGVSGRKRGIDIYDKPLVLGNFLNISVPDRNTDPKDNNTVTFTVKQKTIRDADVTGLEKRRRLLAKCADGFDARMIAVGKAISTACKCPSACGVDEASCPTKAGGLWTTITLAKRVCTPSPSPYDPTGAIVGGVIGGFFGLLLLCLLAWYFCFRKEKKEEPVGRPVPVEAPPPAKQMAPVYLPQPYPELPAEQYPAPMPAYPMPGMEPIVQPTGLPTLYSSLQAPGGYPAPYGVVPQPAYGM